MRRRSLSIVLLESRTVPTTIQVTSLNDSGTGTLRAALAQADAAAGHDTIVFKLPAPPAHSENVITLTSGELASHGDVTIAGPGAGKLIVSGNRNGRVFDFNDGNTAADSPATVTGLSIVSGSLAGGRGGGIYSTESLSLTGVALSGNYAEIGGAVFVEGFAGARSVTITKSQVSGNSASFASGGLELQDMTSVKLSNSTISGNFASEVVGGVYADLAATGTGITVSGCAITGNSARNDGGMALLDPSTVPTAKTVVSGCTILGNSSIDAYKGAGGLYLGSGTLVVTGCTVRNNTAVSYGGGIEAVHFASLTVAKSSITGNQTTGQNGSNPGGGGLFIKGGGSGPLVPATISGCTVSDNSSAYWGGGALVTGGVRLTVAGSTFTGDRAEVRGGGLATYGTQASQVVTSVVGCAFAGDSGGDGGGLDLRGDGPAALAATKVTGCAVAGSGGGIYAALNPAPKGFVMTGCTVSGNTAATGGGLELFDTPDFHISSSSFTNNWVANYGGGIMVENSGGSILGTTVSGNMARDFAAGVYHVGSGTITLQAAKVHGNTAPAAPDVFGAFTYV